ncbi:hypothetical protein BDB01DRAFT_797347 [Pilobolus umbonatus]|nr:hypothetical protein BDB01DRAFT_797347 [Pilobolus umbonatus]
MAKFNQTAVYINSRQSKQRAYILQRIPVAKPNESFYFNHGPFRVDVFCLHANDNAKHVYTASDVSLHITNKRLILVSQSASITGINMFNSCEFQLSEFQSLKTEMIRKKKIRLEIRTVDGGIYNLEIAFKDKKDASSRRDSLSEYLKMATSAVISSNQHTHNWYSLGTHHHHEELPSYLEAVNDTLYIAPPAYT